MSGRTDCLTGNNKDKSTTCLSFRTFIALFSLCSVSVAMEGGRIKKRHHVLAGFLCSFMIHSLFFNHLNVCLLVSQPSKAKKKEIKSWNLWYIHIRMLIDLMKENGFILKKARSRRYPAQTITDADYADDIALLANTPVQAESLLHSLEKAAGSWQHRPTCQCGQNKLHTLQSKLNKRHLHLNR